jgi:hypothetical protein
VHHCFTEHIAARHFSVPDFNDLQECMFLVYKHIDNALQQNLGNVKFEMLLILAFNTTFIKDMENKNLFIVDNMIASLRSTVDATEATMNIIKYFDLNDDVEDDKTDEGMEIITMLKSTTRDI